MKTKLFYLLIIFFTFQNVAEAQTKFSRFFWQTLGEKTFSTAVAELSDGGYVMAGTVKDSAAGSLADVFLAKFNSVGDTVWTRRIAAPGSEGINDVQQTNDGGFILTGWSDSYGPIYGNVLLLKTDSMGNAVWAKVFGNNSTSSSEGYSVRQNADSGFVVAGEIQAPINKSLIIRTNSTGDTLWTKTYSLGTYSKSTYAEENPAGEFIICLEADTLFSGFYLEILKVSSSGTPIWARKVVSPPSVRSGNGIKLTLDGGYLLTGMDYLSGADIVALKFDDNGNFIFGKNFHPTLAGYLENLQATQLADSTYFVVASFYSVFQQSKMALMLKLNPAGDTIFTRSLPDTYFNHGGAFTSDGGFISVDYSGSIYKLDSSFNMECIPAVQGSCTSYDYTCSNSYPYDSVVTLIVTSGTFTSMNNVPRRLYTPCTPNVPTCVVTVDSATQKNLVVWEENFDTTFIDSYQVYKESAAAGVYNLIGSVPHNQLSTFLDTNSNPAAQSDRYRVSALWHNYYEPPNTVAGHKTIHLLVSPGLPPTMNLSWSSYEGFTYSTYNIWRGNSITSSIIASLPFGTNNYTDLNPPPGDSLYYVEVVHAPCNPTFRFGNGGGGNSYFSVYNGTISNRFNTSVYFVGVNDNEYSSGISLFPLPAENELIISSKNFLITSVIITNTLGQQIAEYNFGNQQSQQVQVDISDLSPGMYSLQVYGSDNRMISKLLVKR